MDNGEYRSKWRDALGMKFLLGDAPRPEHCGFHSHQVPLVSIVLKGNVREVDGRKRSVERGPYSVGITARGDTHAHEILSDRVMTLCFAVDEPFRKVLGDEAEVFDMNATIRTGRLPSLIPRLQREIFASDQASDLIIQGLVLEFAGELKRRQDRRLPSDPPEWLRHARELIHDRGAEAFGIAEVAKEVGVHPSHLARVFRQHMRESPGEYLRRIRMERATREVLLSKAPLKVIAERAGFSDQAHFSREFRRIHGVSPLDYRLSSVARI